MRFSLVIFLLLSLAKLTFGQNVIGKWKTIDDNTGEPRSLVDVFERSGKVYGKITKLYRKPGEDPDPVCDDCEADDSRYLKKIIGMEIIEGLIKDADEYGGGSILDPENGKVYRCKIWVEDKTLKVRGYLGPFYRTQTWLKAD
ncbi:MAG: DUF2147 domain-containing protein [Bacteroidia bacterium]|nr:DUF2147 domain-containing protein [Bacteroidia bacterium]